MKILHKYYLPLILILLYIIELIHGRENFLLFHKAIYIINACLIIAYFIKTTLKKILLIEFLLWFTSILLFSIYPYYNDPYLFSTSNVFFDYWFYYFDIFSLIIRGFLICYFLLSLNRYKTIIIIVLMIVLFYLKVEYFPLLLISE